uniref:Uncharacterized protein n=1 Tax=Pseudictyota dubia TaxID=2749911 RepID=A0A7R9ZFE5_9STRA|mmetsp:Transcript_43876/g.81593  ORF Transcript_43876/g.81593 Transcript_43876/m.81593 type:complete len:106 (+) Transcript_43876:150-467(+)
MDDVEGSGEAGHVGSGTWKDAGGQGHGSSPNTNVLSSHKKLCTRRPTLCTRWGYQLVSKELEAEVGVGAGFEGVRVCERIRSITGMDLERMAPRMASGEQQNSTK